MALQLTEKKIQREILIILLFCFCFDLKECNGTTISSITPNRGSLNGGTRITIDGSGFSKDNFNEGNVVQLVSSTKSYACDIHKDGTTDIQVTCYTVAMPEDDYYVRLTVDNTAVPIQNHCRSATDNRCKFRPTSSSTPSITSVTPTSGSPGSILRLYGKIFTDRYGSNIEASSNGRSEKILRVYAAGRECLLKMDQNVFYGLQLDNDGSSDYGYMDCKLQGTFVGNNNASVLIEGEFGRTKPDKDTLHVYSNDQIAMFQTYAVINSTYPSTGSLLGGQTLTITGNYFDETKSPAKVFVGGKECPVKGNVTDNIIECETPSQPQSSAGSYPGNRGLILEFWNETSKSYSNLADVSSMNESASDYIKQIADEAYFVESNWDNYVSRMRGYFIPPHTGEYSFHIKADDSAILYMSPDDNPANKVEIASCPSYSTSYTRRSQQGSSKRQLTKGSSYYIEVLQSEGSVGAFAKVAARFYDTKFTNATIQRADQETQVIKVRSKVERENEEIYVENWSQQSVTYEVQEVTVSDNSGGYSGAPFRLGMYGVYTKTFEHKDGDPQDTAIAAALTALPVFDNDESVSVSTSVVGSAGYKYTFTFSTERGDLPDIQYETPNGSLDITVTQKTRGVASGKVVVLSFDGVPSPPIKYDASAADVTTALMSLFGTRCEDAIVNPSSKKIQYNFESSSCSECSSLWGWRATDIESFCGKGAILNPAYLYRDDASGIPLNQQMKMVCFGYLGQLYDNLRVYYSYVDDQGEDQTAWTTVTASFEVTRGWHYGCYDILTPITAAKPLGSLFTLKRIQPSRKDSKVYFDEIYLGRDATLTNTADLDKRRMKPAKPNGVLINSVEVQKIQTGVGYNVTLIPLDCGYNFPTFEGVTGQAPSGGSIRVQRNTVASPPIGGDFSVTFRGKTKSGIIFNVTGEELREKLVTIPEFGDIYAYRHGDCVNFDLYVTYLSLAGNQELIQVDGSRLTGVGVTIQSETVVDGALWYDPIPGDMLRTVHDKPQIMVVINDVPTKCVDNCDYEWTSGSTPTVTAVSPSSGTYNTEVTITGTGFDSTPSNNVVMIGGAACNVKSSTSSSIVCDTGDGPLGSYVVEVNVFDKGLAQHNGGSQTFEYTSAISGINPTSGALGGGIELTVSGHGFTNSDLVTIGGSSCSVRSKSSSKIVCVVPSSSNADVGQDVKVVQPGQQLTSSAKYTYSSAATITISSVTPTTSGVKGGGTLTISGSNFGSSGVLRIGDTEVNTTSFTNTQVTAILPPMRSGQYDIKLFIGSDGAAVLSNGLLPTVTYELKVTNVSPLRGSIYGGTRLTITGVGFSIDKNETEVKVGVHKCDVESTTANQIVCLIADTATIQQIDNQGFHYEFGQGYAWNPSNINVTAGDIVRWTWSYPSWVGGMNPRVLQTEDDISEEHAENGFISGETGSPSGSYQHRFTVPGTYYFWSGWVDEFKTTNFRGSVTVNSASSSLGEVSLKIAGYEAVYDTNSGVSSPSSGGCQGTTFTMAGCNDALPSGGDANKFNFAFWACNSPVVSSLNKNTGTSKDVLIMSGSGFSTTQCQNEIAFGSAVCTSASSTASQLRCSIDTSNGPNIGVQQELNVRIGNNGNALVAISGQYPKTFGIVPEISGISPSRGSLNGDTDITLSGSGFSGTLSDIMVDVGGYPCPVVSVTYTEVVCRSQALSSGIKSVGLTVTVGGMNIQATCTNSPCEYIYDNSVTPTVTAVSPSTLNGTMTPITITGTQFGEQISDANVRIGGESCSVTSVSNTVIQCDINNAPVGNTKAVKVFINGLGKATSSSTIASQAVASSVTPSEGSTNGKTLLTIAGNGFVNGATTVDIDGSACTLDTVTLSEITCRSPAHALGDVTLTVTSDGTTYPTLNFKYSSASTPVVSSITPSLGSSGSQLTLTGQNFGATNNENNVTINGVPCTVTSSSSTSINCTAGAVAVGTYPVVVDVQDKGRSNNDQTFQYELRTDSISPVTGSVAGKQTVTITGSGFDESIRVTICGQTCSKVSSATQTASKFVCETPQATGVVSTQLCNIVTTVNSLSQTLTSAYTYDVGITSEITNVTPQRGGTGGGSLITISGTGFGTNSANVDVTIAGTTCTVNSVTSTQIICQTGQHSPSIKTNVRVEIAGNGIATQTSAEFHYVDVWSSLYTWGGGPLPIKDDMVVIQAGQSILLDTDTPVLSMLLIQGGELIFDEKDVELKAVNILVTDGGKIQVGTEENPFQHKAYITLYGHHRSKELPIYGTKSLAVRQGTLDLHGIPVPITWTKLETTASAGSNTIELQDAVTWNVGDEIVIASTGYRTSQKENEKRTISAISANKKILTLTEALTYTHVAVTETLAGKFLEYRAEVGLLTHNVVVRGYRDPQWDILIPACPDGFDPGEFAIQTCFQGRFGEEMGSDQFGGIIFLHAVEQDSQLTTGRISHIEVTHAGQAFRLGRYPIHFHLLGDMPTSYVKGCSIHHTFNRAVNVHGTHNVMIERNVFYNVMGGAMFLEDGVETGNTFQFNLGIFVIGSSSLLNDDVTPATFWVTNPNNTIQHNAAAGGTHFGYWYRMHGHPQGPSRTSSVCPQEVPLGVFANNTAHSFGWFGLWIFETYIPRTKGDCTSGTSYPAVFDSLFAWNNEKGAEGVNSGAMQFHNFILVNNILAGYEGKKIVEGELYTENAPMVKDALIVARSGVLPTPPGGCTSTGIVMPFGWGFHVNGTTFVNFNTGSCAAFAWTRIAGTSGPQNGGFHYKTQRLVFNNSPNKGRYAWEFEGIVEDVDATLTGTTGGIVVPTTGTVPASCNAFSEFSVGFPASLCPASVKFHRFSFNSISPAALDYKNVIFTNRYGNSSLPWQKKRMTHPKGWMACLVRGEEYSMEFENADHLTNISFNGVFYLFDENVGGTPDYVIMKQSVSYRPDRFFIDGRTHNNASDSGLDPNVDYNGDWEYTNGEIKYLVSARSTSRRKRSSSVNKNLSFKFSAYRCYFKDCIPPPDPNTIPPITTPPDDKIYWSNASSWALAPDGWGGNYGNGTYGLPLDGDDVMIVEDQWMVADTQLPNMNKLVLYGVLELDYNTTVDGSYRNFNLNVTYLIILGGRLIIGWEDRPFLGDVHILLNGDHSTPTYPLYSGPAIGSKVIGVFGQLDLHGKPRNVTWTKLAQTGNIGDNTITLETAVDWEVGDEIVIAPTGFSAWETETFRITAVSNAVLSLNDSLRFRHLVNTETHNGMTIDMAAEVGLLTRNIKIEGADYNKLYEESFGARIIVGMTQENGNNYIGAARISNVEFYHSGQEGWVEPYDARYSVAFIDAGVVSAIKPSYVKKCAFHHGFSPAVGVYGLNGLPIEDNVIHHTVWYGIETTSDNTQIRRNFLTLMVYEGTYLDRFEPSNVRYNGFINAMKSTNLILEDNHVAGSERVGYRVPPKVCGSRSSGDAYVGNKVHSSLLGVVILPEDSVALTSNCHEIVNFDIWKIPDFAIYYQGGPSVIIENNKLADNTMGVFPFISGPNPTSHNYADKTVTVRNMLVVGRSSSFDCNTDVLDTSDHNVQIGANSRSFDGSRHIGVAWPTFSGGGNAAPVKPFAGIKKYQSIKGVMYLQNTTFAHFGQKCSNKTDYAIATNKKNDDGIHPMQTRQLAFSSVSDDHKVLIHRPNVGKINSADCVDMDCDGLKKALLRDEDGTLLTTGTPGAVIPQSEWQWNGDSRRGLGDYRIPKEMLTQLDGTRIPYRTLAPYQGVIRDSSCTYKSAWQAYECHNLNYRVLVIESMDSDTETRRLSPVAIESDGYLDLINGPQDHGWCSGYTCRKRLSTFMAIVATGKNYLMHYTSTSPQKSRFFLLNSQPSEAIRMEVWYSQPFRLDVYHNDEFIMPKNGRFYKDRYLLDPPPQGQPDYYKPDVTTDPEGSNFYEKDAGILYFIVKGPQPILIKTVKEVIVSYQFPSMTVDEFYGEQIVQHLAAFLNIPMSKVRVVEIVSASQNNGRRRRKRSTNNDVLVVAISDPPSNSSNSTSSDDFSSQDLADISSKIVNEVQLGNMSDTVNNTVLGVSIAEPPPDPSSSEWANVGNNVPYTTIVPADSMRFIPAPVPLHENVAFSTQPKIQVLDNQGNQITNLGASGSPWEITASLRAGSGTNPAALLQGNLTVQFVNGWANFTDLLITHPGSGYVIDFNVTSPTEGENFTISTNELTIAMQPVKASVVSMTSDVYSGAFTSFTLELQDDSTSATIPDIAWRNHVWTVTAELGMPSLYSNVSLSGGSQVTFNPSTSRADFFSIQISDMGMYVVKFHITSSPADYDFYTEVVIPVKSADQASIVVEDVQTMVIKFDSDYNTVVGTNDKYFAAMVGNYYANLYPDILFSNVAVSSGSIVVTFTISGNVSSVNTTIYSVCSGIQSGTSFTFSGSSLTLSGYMTVGGVTYYGVSCGDIASSNSASTAGSSTLHVAAIVAICLVSVAVIVAVIVLIIWKCKYSHTKIHEGAKRYYGNETIEDILFREKTFMSIRDKAEAPRPPVVTTMYKGNLDEKKHPLTPTFKNNTNQEDENRSVFTPDEKKRALTPSSLIICAPSPTPSQESAKKKQKQDKQYEIFPLPDHTRSPSPSTSALYGIDVDRSSLGGLPLPDNIRSPSPQAATLLNEKPKTYNIYPVPDTNARSPSPGPDFLYGPENNWG